MSVLSVIIPTHNRSHYAIPTIKGILSLSPDIEVVVCDTSEVDLISQEFEQSPNTDRLRLIRPNHALSVVDNFNVALASTTGDYLIFIGDDDFVLSDVVEIARWAKLKKIDAVRFTTPILYFWPDFVHARHNDRYAGKLFISKYTKKISKFDSRVTLDEALANFGAGVMHMPRAYAGMISRDLVEIIETKYGKLFGGVSPDIYSAALISVESRNCVEIDFPGIVPGASGASTAGQSANKKHIGGLRDNAHIGAFKNLIWDQRIPEFYSVPTVWSFSLLKAVEVAKIDLSKVNFSRLYVKCFIYQFSFKHHTLKSFLFYLKGVGLLRGLWSFGKGFLAEFLFIFKKIFGLVFSRFLNRSIDIREKIISTELAIEELKICVPSIKSTLD